MEVRFIGQGLELDSHQFGEIIRNELNNTTYTSFNCFVAFLSEGAINRLQHELSNFISRGNEITLYVGIHNNGTSRQALEALLQIGINTYIFYNNRSNPIYHPKAYIFKNANSYSLFVGSNNFTTDGFFSNVESAIGVSANIPEEEQLLNEVELFFAHFLDNTDLNLQLLTEELLNTLEQSGLIPNQDEYYRSSSGATGTRTPQRDEDSSLFPSRPVQSPPRRTSAYNNNVEETNETPNDSLNTDFAEDNGIINTIEDNVTSNNIDEIDTSLENEEEAIYQKTIWFETRKLTSGSSNQLDLSKRGNGTPIGGVDLFNPSRINNLEITIRFENEDYFGNKIYYPTGSVRDNGTWRLQMKGVTSENRKFTDHTRRKQLWYKILLFHEIGDNHYELEVLEETELTSLINNSSFSSYKPPKGRNYGRI